jgi:hypothetical protein
VIRIFPQHRTEYFLELDWGARTIVAPSGDVYLEDAKNLQRELVSVLGKYLGKRGSRAYLTGLFLCEAQVELELTRP